MRFLLGVLVLVFNLADNATTFVCLRQPVPGFEVFEANPLAAWLFDKVGLVEGLVFEMLITTAAVTFLVWTTRLSGRLRLGILAILVALPAWAAANNMLVMRAIQIPVDWF